MLIVKPLVLGLIIGVIVFLTSRFLNKKTNSKFIIHLPAIVLIIISIILFYIGYVSIRGFEGASYSFLGVIIFISTIISILIFNTKAKENNESI